MKLKISPLQLAFWLLFSILSGYYLYFFVKVNGHYEPNGTDEFLYSLEAKGIAKYNQFTTPISFDGVTSKIGDFGIHGIFYATLDGLWAKITNADQPNILAFNFLIAIFALFLIFKTKIWTKQEQLLLALLLICYPPLFRYTFSFYKETIQWVWGIVLTAALIRLYARNNIRLKDIFIYFLIVLAYTQFRYNGFLWIFGLIPLIFTHPKLRWPLIFLLPLTVIAGVLSNILFVAPFPYPEVFNYVFMESLKTKPIGELIIWLWQHFYETLVEFLFQHDTWQKAILRYLLLSGILGTGCLAYRKKDSLLWGLFAVGMFYLLTTLGFYHAHWELDIRSLSILLIPIGFVLVRHLPKPVTLVVIALELMVLPLFVKTSTETIAQFQQINATSPYKDQLLQDFAGMSNTLSSDPRPVVQLPVELFLFNQANYPIHLPLKTNSGQSIYYNIYRGYQASSTAFTPVYTLSLGPQNNGHPLVYAGSIVHLYRLN